MDYLKLYRVMWLCSWRIPPVTVLDQGRVVQTGTFDDLKQQDGAFKNFVVS